ncbi:MAG: amidohydrolase [Balneolaceae bacterium]
MSDIQDIINLRHTLHRYPELSNLEFETSRRISAFMQQFKPQEVLHISKTGKAFVFEGKEPGETLIFRCELDALPIQEKSHNLAYRSSINGVAHLCGHDGHMAVIARLGQMIAKNRPKKGKAVLLFQPAEETYLGAKDVVESPEFHSLSPDYIFAMHNIPGAPKNKVLVKEGSFSAASCGLTIQLEGLTSHASEPEKGFNPYDTAKEIITEIKKIAGNNDDFSDHTIATLIYIRLGEISFGISPGSLEMGITLRAYENKDLELLCHKSEDIVRSLAREAKLEYHWSYSEEYPATVNDPECVKIILESAHKNKLGIEEMQKPNNWSEDFAYYTATNRGAQFGFGAGEDQPPLHNPEYDFPDDIIDPAANIFFEIYNQRLR